MGGEQQGQPAAGAQEIAPGSRVYSADGHHIGTVDEIHATYFVAAKGLFFPQDRYVPHSAVGRIDHDGIHLVHRQQEIEVLGWQTFPEETPARPDAPAPAGEEQAWEDVRAEHHAHWQATRTDERERWEEVEPLHRYGWELAHNRRYQYLLWSEVEPNAREDWEAQHPDRLWSAVAPSIKRAWERTMQADQASPATPAVDQAEGRALDAAAQQLRLDKEQLAGGDVAVRRERITEVRTVEVPLTREELVVTRRPRDGADAGADDTVRIPLREERVVVQKSPLTE